MLPTDAILPLALFVLLIFVLALHGLTASGHFPREHRAPALTSGAGQVVLYGSIVVALACLAVGLVTAWRLIPWYAAIIGGGLAVLLAPLVLQKFPDRFLDGRGALLVFAGVDAVVAGLLVWVA